MSAADDRALPGAPAAGPGGSGGVLGAVAVIEEALEYLAGADAAGLAAEEQAEALRGLERASSRLVVARSRVLGAFVSGGGLAADGQCSARGWLVWQSRVTRGAAGGAVGWVRRLAAHPVFEAGLAAGELSESWVRQLADWTDRLPEDLRQAADQILAEAAAGGADLDDLAGLAREMRERAAGPDTDAERGFTDRRVRLEQTFQGAGRLDGDLTPECAAALAAVLESLGRRAGPEDLRSREQRDHDALEEACRRLTAAGCLPEVAGQPVMIQLHMTLDQLARAGSAGPGPGGSMAAGTSGGYTADSALAGLTGPLDGAGSLSGPAAEAYACDAKIAPVVTGRIDPAALAWMVRDYLDGQEHACPAGGCAGQCPSQTGSRAAAPGPASQACPHSDGPASASAPGSGASGLPGAPGLPGGRLGDTLARYAVQVLSGPGGLAAALRARAGWLAAAGASLPLDTGTPTATVPSHLRRAVTTRDRHCAFPGCGQPPAACHVHHLIPRSRGGVTALHNLALLCSFHHLIAVHRWGWALVLHPDGTTSATSPGGARTLHSHSPPLVA